MLTSEGPIATRVPRDTRCLAVLSAMAALVAVDLVVVAAGRDAIAFPSTAARIARTACGLAAPGLILAALAPWLTRRVRFAGSILGAAVLTAIAVTSRDTGGLLLTPAAVLLIVAGLQREATDDRWYVRSPARHDLVSAAAIAALVGAVGRAFTLDGIASTLSARTSVAVSGLILLAWPLIGASLLPPRVRQRGLLAAGAAVVALVGLRSPAGGEAWLVPGLALLLMAVLTEPGEEEVAVGPF